MKTKLFLPLLPGLLYLTALTPTAKAQSVVDPPTLPHHDAVAAVMQQPNDVEIVFLEDVEDAEVTVVDESGVTVYHARGAAHAYGRVAIDASRWRGRYKLNVKANSLRQQQTLEYR